MNPQGVRPHRLWHWAAIGVLVATTIHNPGGTAEFAITALDNAGSALGWALDRGGFDGESDYFIDTTPTTTPPPGTGPAPESDTNEFGLEGTADQIVVEIVELHELVEATLADGGTP